MQVQKVSNNNVNKSFKAKYIVTGTSDEIVKVISRAEQHLARHTSSRLMLDYGPIRAVLFGTDNESVEAIQKMHKKLYKNSPTYIITSAYKSFLKLPLDKKLEQIFGDGAKDVKQYEAKNTLGPFDYMKGMRTKGLDINEATIKYIAENVPKEDLPEIASAFDLFQNSSRIFSFDSSTGHLVADIAEKNLLGELHHFARFMEGKSKRLILEERGNLTPVSRWVEDEVSITDIVNQCFLYLEDINFVQAKTRRNIKNTVDYTKRFAKYI